MEKLASIIRRLDKRYGEICGLIRENIYVLPLAVTVTMHKRIHRGKTYTWSEKRVTIPSGWDDDTVYVMRDREYQKLVKLLSLLRQYCRE